MKIVIGVDGREHQLDAVALGRLLATSEADEVVVAHVYPTDWVMPVDGHLYEKAMAADSAPIVEAAVAALGRPARTMVFGDLSPARGLHHLAEDEDADVLVLGSSHHGRLGRVLPGGVGERVVHGAPCAVAIAPRGFADRPPDVQHVGVAYDASPEARAALAWAAELAGAHGADLTLYRVVETPHLALYPAITAANVGVEDAVRRHTEELEHTVAGMPASLHAHGEVLHGRPSDALATATAEQDVMVAGSRGYGALGTVLTGSVSRALLGHASAPVVILPRRRSAVRAHHGAALEASGA